uniref:DDE Tnp4 domain-containing protein n=1 Tax=Ciona savignyi TaxID=51511 RepID=H2Y6X0_CIOSA
QLLSTLWFYATGQFQMSDGDLIGLNQSTVSRIVHRISRCIAKSKSNFIKFPTNLQREKESFYVIAGFPSVVGAIDCTHVAISTPGGGEVFRNRKGYYSINVQAIRSFDRQFTNVVVRWPGSTHDSRIFENSIIHDRFENDDINGMLLGDNGYACKGYLMTPLLNPSSDAERRYNKSHIKTRSRIEQSFGVLKQRFRALRIPLRTKLDNSLVIIVAIFCLHNFAMTSRI